jgi:hypothetical protein
VAFGFENQPESTLIAVIQQAHRGPQITSSAQRVGTSRFHLDDRRPGERSGPPLTEHLGWVPSRRGRSLATTACFSDTGQVRARRTEGVIPRAFSVTRLHLP